MTDQISPLKDRTALVTGASAGIGEALALRLAEQGAHVVITARRIDRLEKVRAEIEHRVPGSRIEPIVADLTHEDQIVSLCREAESRLEQIDMLINNAGHGYVAPTRELDAAELDRIWAVNLRAPMILGRELIPSMAGRRFGSVVNVGSVSSRRGWAGGAPYVAVKHGLRGLTESWEREFRPWGIRVMAIYPNYVRTEFFDAMGVDPGREILSNALTADDVARAITFALAQPPAVNVAGIDLWPSALGG